jgi:hypothetical protein
LRKVNQEAYQCGAHINKPSLTVLPLFGQWPYQAERNELLELIFVLI